MRYLCMNRQSWPGLRRMAAVAFLVALTGLANGYVLAGADAHFTNKIVPLLEQRCLGCHGASSHKGGLSLATAADARAGGDSGPAMVPGKPDDSLLLQYVSGAKPRMPRKGTPLTPAEVTLIRTWIADGAHWPGDVALKERRAPAEAWWSLQPLRRPAVPTVQHSARVRNPIDAFVLNRLEREGMAPGPEADRRTLIRRLSYDLLGLPPSPEEVDAFVNDPAADAYERLVDRLLASPHYGERWARHWLDVVHYGDTHGYDKDKPRPNAWPYRDYVIRAFNEDRPYTRFIQEQLAGDRLFPNSRDSIVALGFLAAGPWDLVGQIELGENTLDKQITRNLDRDDMVATTMNTFASVTVQCARCHDHKFDPISQEDYYSLQAVFAGVDRADRSYETDPFVTRQRIDLKKRQAELAAKKQTLDARLHGLAGSELAATEKRIEVIARLDSGDPRPEFGYHSHIEPHQDAVKWVQVDLGRTSAIASVVYVGCHDDFNNIGAGFGFPLRYKIDISDDPTFRTFVTVLSQTQTDMPNPGVKPQSVTVGGKQGRYVRMTATKLALRANDYIFALGELSVLAADGRNLAAGAPVTALDSIDVPPRWQKQNLVDGYYYGMAHTDHTAELAQLTRQRQAILQRVTNEPLQREIAETDLAVADTAAHLAALPAEGLVYAAAIDFPAVGSFTATQGRARPIFLLRRGSEKNPVHEVGPGSLSCLPELGSRFGTAAKEAERRAALARWLIDPRNPLTWRSIVNRVWHYHFGQGIVDTPNDFGHMGARPSHPELLDWLAVEFRDQGQSIKQLHRLIVTSATYRQSSAQDPHNAQADSSNRCLWRMNRRRLEAEEIRDTVLVVSGKLDSKMYGPGFMPFGFKDDYSPHYVYEEHDPDDPAALRRSIYRFLVRSVPDPFMETLDCADPSLKVEKRSETLTALQALALLNDKLMLHMAGHFARRVQTLGRDLPAQIRAAYRLALGREPTPEELPLLADHARKHGLPDTCRLILNLNEFCFVD